MLTTPVLPNKIIIAKPITNGGVIIGKTDNILSVDLASRVRTLLRCLSEFSTTQFYII